VTRVAGASDVARFRALLEANHEFPGPYRFSVITLTDEGVVAALRGTLAARGLAVPSADEWVTQASSGGRYTSHRFTLQCASADEVLALYQVVRAVAGVVAVM